MNEPLFPKSDLTAEAREIIQRIPEIGKAEATKQLKKLQKRAQGVEKMLVARYFEALMLHGHSEDS